MDEDRVLTVLPPGALSSDFDLNLRRDLTARRQCDSFYSATMALEKSKTPPRIRGLNEVGRYAIGIQWSDGHESIFPLENLRRYCPCNACGGEVEGAISADTQRLLQLSRLGDAAVYLAWVDGHETFYTMAQLRETCRCALCVQEPERPITGS